MNKIGPHKINHASITDKSVDDMLAGETIQLLHSDPPWGDGYLKYWATLNKRMTGAQFAPLNYEQLVNRLMQLVKRYVQGFVFIETGLRWEAQLIQSFKVNGLQNVSMVRMRYKAGSKWLEQSLVIGATEKRFRHNYNYGDLEPVKEIERIIQACELKAGSKVLDPCCGMGNCARASVAAGMHFRGNEFNAARLQKTIDFLTKSVT